MKKKYLEKIWMTRIKKKNIDDLRLKEENFS